MPKWERIKSEKRGTERERGTSGVSVLRQACEDERASVCRGGVERVCRGGSTSSQLRARRSPSGACAPTTPGVLTPLFGILTSRPPR